MERLWMDAQLELIKLENPPVAGEEATGAAHLVEVEAFSVVAAEDEVETVAMEAAEVAAMGVALAIIMAVEGVNQAIVIAQDPTEMVMTVMDKGMTRLLLDFHKQFALELLWPVAGITAIVHEWYSCLLYLSSTENLLVGVDLIL
ncbi:uncharacterized protein PAF06_019892 isoform 3-T3 [Gastrophryne carolinensis]